MARGCHHFEKITGDRSPASRRQKIIPPDAGRLTLPTLPNGYRLVSLLKVYVKYS